MRSVDRYGPGRRHYRPACRNYQQVAEARGPSLERGCGSLRDDDGGADSHDAVSDDRGNAADASRRLLHADIHDHRVDRPRQ